MCAHIVLMQPLRVGKTTYEAKRDLIDTIMAAGEFSTFSYALSVAGLVDELKGAGPFTVFAPTDEAFKKLPPEEVEALLRDTPRLRTVLNHHVLRGKLHSWDLTHGTARTVEGTSLTIGATDEGFTVDYANVTKMNSPSSNGVFHAVDTVMIPGRVPARSEAADKESAWSGKRRFTGK